MILSNKFLAQGFLKEFENSVWYRYRTPEEFYPLAGTMIPWFAAAALIACIAGLFLGFFVVSVDARQGEVARVLFIHLPASWVAMLLYLFTATFAAIGLAFNARLAAMAAISLAPTGLLFAFLDIWTGCLWDKAVWGNWWASNLSMFLELALALLYLGFIAVHTAIEDLERANKAGALLLFAGVVAVLFDFAAVQSWTAQHQGTPPGTTGAIRLSTVELMTLLMMGLAFMLYAGAAALLRLRCVILESERQSMWVVPQRGSRAL